MSPETRGARRRRSAHLFAIDHDVCTGRGRCLEVSSQTRGDVSQAARAA